MRKKVIFASTSRLNLLQPELDTILYELALIMKEPQDSVEDWLSFCFVSDESRLIEFIYEDNELDLLRQRLDLPDLSSRDLFVDVATTLRQRKQTGS